MNMNESYSLEHNHPRLAYDFMAAFAIDESAAIAHLRAMLDSMEEWQYRQWVDHLGALLVEQQRSAEEWHSVFSALEAIDADD